MIPDVLIIGAGLAGLTAAGGLHAAGRTVLVLDKGRGVGGRAATRRWDGVPVDHGAQFFTVREGDFQGMTDRWREQGTCFEWTQGFHQWDDDGRGLRPPGPDEQGHPRYACREGMSALAKDLAGRLPKENVRLQSKVLDVRWERDHWQAEVEGGPPGEGSFAGRRLVLALPVPQALALLGASEPLETGSLVSEEARRELRRIETAPALAVLLRGPAPAPDWQGIQLRDAALSWISDDSSKRLPNAGSDRVFVLHGSGEFSRQWQDADLDEAARRLTARAGEIVGDWITWLPGRQVHRWRYASVPHGLETIPFLGGTWAAGAPLYFAGDGFLKGKIEGACRSGLLLARKLLEDIGAG